MNENILGKLRIAQDICEIEDRSTEYMIQFMQDFANVDFEDVIEYLKKEGRFKEVIK